MKTMVPIAVSLVLVLAGPALAASCDDELAALDTRVKAQADTAIATSSGGQGVGAKRQAEAKEARDTHAPVATEQKGPAPGAMESQTTAQAAAAGGAGDRVMQAKVAINDARVAKGKGDEAGCLAAVSKAKQQLAD